MLELPKGASPTSPELRQSKLQQMKDEYASVRGIERFEQIIQANIRANRKPEQKYKNQILKKEGTTQSFYEVIKEVLTKTGALEHRLSKG